MRRTALSCGLVLLWSSAAAAFCRTRVCESARVCELDLSGCSVDTPLVFWSSNCLAFGVQAAGSPLRGIAASEAQALVEQAFAVWNRAGCVAPDVTPAFGVGMQGEIACDVPEFNCGSADPNFNTVMFRDEDWPYAQDAIALTTLTVNTRTGEVLDADIELNAVDYPLTTTDIADGVDLATVLTHEVGHFLGLSHSPVPEATMFQFYDASGQIASLLHADDTLGICEIYTAASSDPVCVTPPRNDAEFTACRGEGVPGDAEGTACDPRASSGCAVSPSPAARLALGASGSISALGLAGMILFARRLSGLRVRRYAAVWCASRASRARRPKHASDQSERSSRGRTGRPRGCGRRAR